MRAIYSGILTPFLLFLVHFTLAQEKPVSGKVTDQSDIPIPGVNIVIKGTSKGTITDFNGSYEITAFVSDTLVFSYVGLKTAERAIDGAETIDVILWEEITALETIDVTALGIERERKTLTYQADKVDSENLVKVIPARAVQGLAAKVAGLQINTQDHGVNPSSQIILRGLRSVSQSNSPIIVIDGSIASQGAFDDLNPLDIESVNVLKGSTAGILYGSLGSNGAIMVTTKQGERQGVFTVGLNSTTSIETVAYMPDFQNEYGIGVAGEYDGNENVSWGPRFDGVIRQIGPTLADGTFQAVPYAAVKDNLKDFFKTGYSFQNTIYLSGGSQSNSFYLSIGDQQTTGLIPSDAYDRNTFKVNASQTLGKLTLSLNSGYLRDKTSVVGSRIGQFEEPIYGILLSTPTNIPLAEYSDWEDPDSFGYADNYYNRYQENPYWGVGTNRNNQSTDRIIANIQASWDITNRLNFTARLGLNNTKGTAKEYRQSQSYDSILQPFKGYISPFVFEREFQSSSYSVDAIIKGNYEVGSMFNITAILGATNNSFESRINSIGYNDLGIPGFFDISNGVGTPEVNLDETEKRIYGFFGDATVGYKDFLYLNLAGRYDFTSTLPESENSYFYPAAGLSFVMSEVVNSMNENDIYLKLSASNSTTYNDLGPYQINEAYSQAESFPYGDLNGFAQSDVAVDPEITKEKINTTEFGINSSFFKNRLTFDAAYFITKSTDLITLTTPSLSSGSSSVLTNIGEIETKGIEITLGGSIIKSDHWGWDASVNFSSNEAVVNEISEGVDEITVSSINYNFIADRVGFYAIVGEAFPQIRATSYLRDPDGRIVVDSESGNPIMGPLENMGKSTPDFILGLTTLLRWKTLSLYAALDYRTGHVYFEEGSDFMEFSGRSLESVSFDRQDVVFPNSVIETSPGVFEENTDITISDGNDWIFWTEYYGSIKENYIKDATALKIREIALNYSFPSKLLRDLPFDSFEIGLVARNYFTFLSDENRFSDPEFQNQFIPENAIGIGGLYQPPPSKSLGVNLKIEF